MEEIQPADARGRYCTIKYGLSVEPLNNIFNDNNDGVLFPGVEREWAMEKNYGLRRKVGSF